jgi:hypothetical protein
MLRDIKDMSLEYLDDNLLLEINVMCAFTITNKVKKSSYRTTTHVDHETIYRISFSHTINKEEFCLQNIKKIYMDNILDTIENLSQKSFIYTISLNKDYDERDEVDDDENIEDWIREEYPEEDNDGNFDENDPFNYENLVIKSREIADWAKEVYPNENII